MPHWQPTASLPALEARAAMYRVIREFFAQRNVLEVETPLLSEFGVTDVHLDNIEATVGVGAQQRRAYLQTSPEYAMKRLLAQHGRAIYQLGKAFRQDEQGRQHNPEFTLLEWYRPGFTHHELMDEIDDLLQAVLGGPRAQRVTYQALFERELGIDPLQADCHTLRAKLQQQGIALSDAAAAVDRDELLQLLMTHCLEPTLGFDAPVFIYLYPKSQAALARLAPDNPLVAERFELYSRGIELANGFHELCDAKEQALRFAEDLAQRERLQRAPRAIDTRLLAALKQGFPACAGVALGIDRLLMLQQRARSISDVISFCWGNA